MVNKRVKIYIIIAVWAIAIGALALSFVQMWSYANIINNAGVVRGGTQRIAKLELARAPNEALILRVETLLSQLQANEKTRMFKGPHTEFFIQDLEAVRLKWEAMKEEIRLVRGGGDGAGLFAKSEEHFALADTAVFSAEIRAERELQWSIAVILALFVLASVFMVLFEFQSDKNLKRVFYTDPLTKHDNNMAFIEKAAALLKNARPGAYLLLYTNVNNFKFVNQSYGHEAGDRLVQRLSAALEEACRQGELFAHTTVDHFVLLLQNSDGAAARIAAALLSALEADTEIHSSGVISCSCGAYKITDGREPVPSMISKATLALSQGRQCHGISFYDDDLLKKLTRETLLEQHMHSGVERGEYQIYLQPKAELATGKIIGAEVLCRWISPELGFLPPDEFIPLFEKNGFIVVLDFYMLEQVCQRFTEALCDEEGALIPVSINFSRVTLLQDDFVERFTAVVAKHKIPRWALEIEVTESAFIMEEETVIEMLETLKAQGFKVVMDDFGLGYSSLNLLRRLPIDVLKIDKGFLNEGAESERVRDIIACIVQMTQKLNIQVVCEGVETMEQVELLRQIGCEIGQGYYYSKPIPVDEFHKKYRTRTGGRASEEGRNA
ncbi:MAG: GGDEF domain-containing phosphodiesterase [Cloacibacillus sp.]